MSSTGDAAITRDDVPAGYSTQDKEGLFAQFDKEGRLRFYALYVQGDCKGSLSLDPERMYGRFESGYAGEIYFRHTIEPISPWHDNASPRQTDESLAAWARGCIQAIASASGQSR